MIATTRRSVLPLLASVRWCGPTPVASAHRYQGPNPAAVTSRRFQAQGASAAPDDSQDLEDEYSKLKVNWFPGHMVKATKIIREKLKQVDMVLEVRDARIPFTSANDDLDRIVGPNKARLIVLNKADLANQALEQRVLQRFREEGKTAVFACGRTGTNVKKLLAWAREKGAKRGEFSTTGAVAMVVGMPNVGKSSLINLLRGKAQRAQGRGGGGGGEDAKQVARVGATPGVTRQVSAFRIASNPPLYLVDTPGVMVPRVDKATQGLYLALTRAIPDASVPPDVLVAFMLRVVRSRMLFGAGKTTSPSKSPRPWPTKHSAVVPAADGEAYTNVQGRPKAVEAWLTKPGMESPCPPPSEDGSTVSEKSRKDRKERAKQREEDDMEELLEAVERESGAEGKPEPEMRRICCRFVLDAFRDGHFGRITLDDVPRVRQKGVALPDARAADGAGTGWARGLLSDGRGREGEVTGQGTGSRGQHKGEHAPEPGRELADILARDWSNPSAWEPAGGSGT